MIASTPCVFAIQCIMERIVPFTLVRTWNAFSLMAAILHHPFPQLLDNALVLAHATTVIALAQLDQVCQVTRSALLAHPLVRVPPRVRVTARSLAARACVTVATLVWIARSLFAMLHSPINQVIDTPRCSRIKHSDRSLR